MYRDEQARRGGQEEILPQPSPAEDRDPIYISPAESEYLDSLREFYKKAAASESTTPVSRPDIEATLVNLANLDAAVRNRATMIGT